MTPVEPETHVDGWTLMHFAKNQPEYLTLPAYVSPTGIVQTEWTPNEEDLAALLTGGRIRVLIHTFNRTADDWQKRPLQPMSVDVLAPECGFRKES